MAKINKALDYNKLLIEQGKGKLLNKHLEFPLYAPIKYDGNYVVIQVRKGRATFTTSGGLNYTHRDDGGYIFKNAEDGVYLAERIWGKGLLGDRNRCNLRGPKDAQTSAGHTYKVFDYLTHSEYERGKARVEYDSRYKCLLLCNIPYIYIAERVQVGSLEILELYLKEVVNKGYEGVMLIQPDWIWKDTKSRKVDFCKWKKRPTVDLLCLGCEEGTGKYEGMIGALVLQDSEGRTVSVGSGMSDEDRLRDPDFFIGKVVEMFYEQIVHTYIQPTFGSEYEGVLIRDDKTKEEID